MVAKLKIIVKAFSRVLHISADKLILSDRGVFILVVLASLVAFLVYVLSGCTSNHYFSINAEEMTNPRIEYKDSTTVTNPF